MYDILPYTWTVPIICILGKTVAKSIKEINRNCPRDKRIKTKYFESTKKEIDYYFDSATRIVKGQDVLDSTKEAILS